MPQLGKRFSLVGPGTIMSPCAVTVMAEGTHVSLVGDLVSPHGEPPHTSSFVVAGSSTVFCEGKPVTLQGSATSCGHTVNTGAITVLAF
tara:strand:- start:129 stop:395 length:267 start_codon:yes stop_codon:yes gene_type:complete